MPNSNRAAGTRRVPDATDAALVKDLHLSFKIHTDYDSNPPSGASSSIDTSIVASIDSYC